MKIIGMIGGIASGKSAVAQALANLGAEVLVADQAAHQLLQQPEIIECLSNRWGPRVLTAEGDLDRRKIAEIVFDSAKGEQERRFLEQHLHPRIREDFRRQIADFSQRGVPAAVIDAPLLLEAKWEGLCDLILFVDSPREMRLQRARQNRGWTEQEFANREATQLPIEEKRARATDSINNSGTLEALVREVRRFWDAKIAAR